MTLKKLKFSLLILFFPLIIKAQSSGPNSWITLDVDKEIKNWDFAAELELRSNGFFERNQRLSLQFESTFKIVKGLEAGASYTVMSFYDQKYDDYQLRNRFAAVTQGKMKYKRFSVNLREKLELTTKDESDRKKGNENIDTYRINPELIWRNRLKVSYDIPDVPLSPSVSTETFYLINDPEGSLFEKIRYTFALDYKLNKHNKIEIFTLYNQELIDEEKDSYVIGIGYELAL